MDKGTKKGSFIKAVAPIPREITRITNFPISLIIEDKMAFSAFVAFCKESHTSENVFFWCAAVAFREIGNPNGWERGLPRTNSWTMQEQLDAKESQRRGTSLLQVKALRESLAVFDRFIATEAPNWVCLPLEIVKNIETTIDSARLAKKGKMPAIPYTVFQEAERYAFMDMIHDILPRFLKQLAEDGDLPMMDYLKSKLKEKEVGNVKISAADQANEMTKPETIANALSALYPTPRACLNNRVGSCLMEPAPVQSSKEKRISLSLSAGSTGGKGEKTGHGSMDGLRSLFSSKSDTKPLSVSTKIERRNSTGSKHSSKHSILGLETEA